MADTKNTVDIEIRTTATGAGAEKTIKEIDDVTTATSELSTENKTLRETIDAVDNISDEARASLHELADIFDEVTSKVKSTEKSEKKLTSENKKAETQNKKTARTIDQINQELAEAKRKLAAAEIGTKEFSAAQAQVNSLSLEASRTIPRASKSTRNLGLAALEGSRAMEDLQYGVGGVVNNIPGLVMMLGGSAGLTAVISLLAVGLNQLSKQFDKTSKSMDVSAKDLEGAEKRKREALKKTEDAVKSYSETLEHADRISKLEQESIDATTKSLLSQAKARAEVESAKVDLELSKAKEIEDPIKRQEVENELLARKALITKSLGDEELKIQKQQLELQREKIKEDDQRLQALKKQTEELKKQKEQTEKSLEIQEGYVSLSEEKLASTAKEVDSAPGEGLGEPDLADMKGDSDVEKIRNYAQALKDYSRTLNRFQKAVVLNKAQKIWDDLDKLEDAKNKLDELSAKKSELDKKTAEADAKLKDGDQDILDRIRKNRELNKALQIQIDKKKQLDRLALQKEQAELQTKKSSIGKNLAKSIGSAGDLSRFGDEDKEVAGTSQADKDFNKQRTAKAAEQVSAILEDNDVSDTEFKPLLTALQTMKQSMSKDNKEGTKTVASLIKTVQSSIKLQDAFQRRIADMQAQIDVIMASL